jgi:hypothetical protein
MGFVFFYDFARSSGLSVQSLEEFASILETVDARSIRFHMEKGDFERWIRQVVGDNQLADEIAAIRISKRTKGEILRKNVLAVTAERIKQLKKITKSASFKGKQK